jgi:flagellin-like hook-associated protein FlgL
LFEFRNVLDVTYGAYVVKGAYRGVGTSGDNAAAASERDQAVALIRELLRGNISAVRQSTRDASTAVSIVQTFAGAIDTIADKLGQMKELAAKAPSPDYSQPQVEQMQEQFESLAKQISQTSESTEYNYNKLFTADGEAVSIPIGDGSNVDIFARDFTFDAQGVNIAQQTGRTRGRCHSVARIRDAKLPGRRFERFFAGPRRQSGKSCCKPAFERWGRLARYTGERKASPCLAVT